MYAFFFSKQSPFFYCLLSRPTSQKKLTMINRHSATRKSNSNIFLILLQFKH